MAKSVIMVRINREFKQAVFNHIQQTGRTVSEVIRESLKRELASAKK